MVKKELIICDYCDDLNKTRLAVAIFERPYDGRRFAVCRLCADRVENAGLRSSLEFLNQ